MKTFETSATVEEQGRVLVAGVPFAPGTEVEVAIRPKVADHASRLPPNTDKTRVRMRDLFARAKARNTESIGPLRREELYDRQVLR